MCSGFFGWARDAGCAFCAASAGRAAIGGSSACFGVPLLVDFVSKSALFGGDGGVRRRFVGLLQEPNRIKMASSALSTAKNAFINFFFATLYKPLIFVLQMPILKQLFNSLRLSPDVFKVRQKLMTFNGSYADVRFCFFASHRLDASMHAYV